MLSEASLCVLLVTVFFQDMVAAQNNFPMLDFSQNQPQQQSSDNLTTEKHAPTRVQIFTDTFVDLVMDSPQLLQIFDVAIPSSQVSKAVFQAYRDSLRSVGANYPDSLAKEFADALYLTLPFLERDIYPKIVSRSLAFYMMTQDFLTFENTALCAHEFSDLIVKNIPVGVSDKATVVSALPKGIVDFLSAHGDTLLKHLPLYSMSTTMYFYAFTAVTKPEMANSVVDPAGYITDAATVYGMERFAFVFSKNVNSSPIFQRVFDLNEPISDISKSWKLAMVSFCNIIECTFAYANYFEKVMNITYKYISKPTYLNIIANAYSLTLIGMGALTNENVDLQANTVTNLIEIFIHKLPLNANITARIGVIFSALQSIVPSEIDVTSQYGAFASYIALGLYSSAPVAATFPSY